ncbi:START domain-containing protein [Desulfatibacillum alkenivorans DSM 16219]|uniref:START domain-containing protein n=1 Tax=Desulfatibacillum alkenivorans DSM 16219 TaxID=1121393 RepID=A0A1M6I5Q4_9BACT|nr:START domain-containing protein [Desulfatibacillum alkenivorans]SHJ29768.1 START domain-containing protein [Desulfatibacillum alkenivorans DSM 16219]
MRRVCTFSALMVIICAFLSPVFAGDGAWQLVRDEDGVQTYSRQVEGTDFLEFEAVTEISASVDLLDAVLLDVANYSQWMAKCNGSELVETLDDGSLMIYYVQALPWPCSDRDMVFNAITTKDRDKGIMEIQLQMDPDAADVGRDKRTPMRTFQGRIYMAAIDKDKTEVRYRVIADPAGTIPVSAVNAFSKTIPGGTLLGMKKMAVKEKYIKAAMQSQMRESGKNG